ncbi:MAG TPA: hypothetical protein VHN79_13715, partial [Lacunisphaera sp.]|nr:hypothetical protein [Lacunisphaera sp.]
NAVNDGDGGLEPAAFRAASLPRTPSARPDRYPPDGAPAEEEADGVTAARRWRDVCRLDH